MKKWYILSAVAAISLTFASCDKEDMYMEPQQPEPNGNGDFIINPEDTAGIVVPEGCGLVVFPGNRMQTRASLDPVTGESNRISTLRILIYKENENGTFEYVKAQDIQNPTNWPLSGAATTILETGTYRAVFVGNMDASLFGNEEVLTGVGEGHSYADARINLPSIDKFSTLNLFHWFSSGNFEVTENTTIVPVTLQRIVSRSSLTTYGIPDGIEVTGSDYPSRFYTSLLDKNHPAGLYDMVFGKPFEKGLQEMLERDLIFPLAYVLAQNNKLDERSAVGQWYNSLTQDEYLTNYIKKTDSQEGYTKDGYDNIEAVKEGLSTLSESFSKEYSSSIDAIPEYLNKLYSGDYTEAFVAQIITDNLSNVDDYESGRSRPSFTVAKEETVNALKEAQSGSNAIFPTWDKLQDMTVTLSGTYPSTIDFDLKVCDTKEIAETSVKLTTLQDGNSDKVLNIYLLGENGSESTYQFGLTSLSDYTTDGISGQTLQPNTWTEYRLVPEDITLGENQSDKKCKIIVRYKYLSEQIESNRQAAFLKLPLKFSHNLNTSVGGSTGDYFDFTNDTGRLLGTVGNGDQVHFFFAIPDFSASNLTATIKWVSEEKVK